MKIIELELKTNKLNENKQFFTQILELDLIENSENYFSIQIGWTKLKFIISDQENIYHYSFLIPKNQLQNAYNWMKNKVEILETEKNNVFSNFEAWNAKSFYFYDGSNNLAEMIIHANLDNESNQSFDASSILGISEIGLPTLEIEEINQQIEDVTNSKFWKGDFDAFGTNGSDEGKILLPNYNIKKTWYPTENEIKSAPFRAIINVENNTYKLAFNNQQLEINNYD
ncbi:glyoxalase [Algoriella sp.]|uniref:glyoxalase n=1 Tax=Algoriella sp. TaxID=1872434 RepID=UPI001B02EAE5|nr:glyoxalase [Algoriella sp.]MBO6211503.1 glyoxalase [Algoriella sp.]